MDSVAGLTGQTIGKYRIVEHLGRGGMAEVYKAYQPSLDRYVALKLMHAFLAGDQDFIARFEREAKNVAALRYPNIIQVFDFDVHNGAPFMVMEFIEGGTLKSHIEALSRAGTPLELGEAVRIIREVGRALAYAHQRSMIHRDVKPANVLLDAGNRVILTDFGIAKILTGPSFTMTGATVGTPAYMSPEQSLGRPGDHRSDIYALGVMLYQLATGQLPYEADTPLAVMLKHVNEPLPLPRTFAPDLPEGLERIILKSMAKNPDDRFQSADEMLAQLDDLSTARHLAIPPASMAAGVDAHAATVMPSGAGSAHAPLPTLMAGPVVKPAVAATAGAAASAASAAAAGATQLHQAAAGAPLVRPALTTPPPATAPLAPPAPPRSWLPLFVGLGLVLLLLALGSGAFAFTGGFGLLPRASQTPTTGASPSPSTAAATDEPQATGTNVAGTSTPDLVSTQFASIQLTQEALVAELATATPTETPDLTATALACTYAFALTEQDPPDGSLRTTGANTAKTIRLANAGDCPFPEGTVFTETVPSPNLPAIALPVPAVKPGEFIELQFDWPGLRQAGTATRVFELHLPGGTLVGEPVTFTFRYALPPTQRPAVTNTPVPPPATNPPPAGGLSDIYPGPVISCKYQGDNNMDYSCTVRLGWGGAGTGRMTLYLDGQQVGAFNSAAGEQMYYNVVSRRCFGRSYNIQLIDDATATSKQGDFYFDPASSAALFPGAGCTLP
jgi:hypothetical protein